MMTHSELLGKENIKTLLIKMSAPAMVGMAVQSMYSLVDAIFVGRAVGTVGLAGLQIAFPIQILVMSIAQTVGVGGASIISRSLGKGDKDHGEKTVGNIFFLLISLSLLISVFGLLFTTPILKLFGATEASLPYALEYIQVILLGSVIFVFAMGSNNIVRAEGNAKVAMITMIISAGLNIILDPIFIFGFNMGIRGAALATVLAQSFAAIYLLYYFIRGKSSLKVRKAYFRPDMKIIREIFLIGASTFARMAAGTLMSIILNHSLAHYGDDTSLAVFVAINKLLTFTLMPLLGIVQGMQPIVGYNYGAKEYPRVHETLKLAIIGTTGIATLAYIILMTIPGYMIGLFNDDPELIAQGVRAIRINIFVLPVIGYQIVGAGMFQSIGKARPAIILSLARQVLILIPLALILPLFMGTDGIWLAFPISDLLSTLITHYLMRTQMRSFRLIR
ncbi:MATE family efflux transporter [Isachenkonia alkalipeptolytica]|uniref:Multidrug export protein MepA n=1 Tax=Isachenkonia alkalipeptolytica TaxID=2565777 RepID=A0AA43XIC5_9CLOT|nr:MATE family efflux transporter [Isachenkonia alkalipeptolytica]NBG87001.1 MATE family efflux transporter [Isachenkonia alkalipeptolytica]